MTTKRMKSIAVLGGLALAAASQALADTGQVIRGAEVRIETRRTEDGRYEDRRFQERRQARLQAIAHEIDELAGRVASRVVGARYSRRHSDQFAQRRLDSLADAADRFHSQVERRRADFGRTLGDYRALVRTYDRASDSFASLRAPGPVRRDFRRLSYKMEELSDLFENRWNEHDQRRYDRDRFDDDRPDDWSGSGR